jgi:RNA polymerase sigma-70 factor (ECF subfamily)
VAARNAGIDYLRDKTPPKKYIKEQTILSQNDQLENRFDTNYYENILGNEWNQALKREIDRLPPMRQTVIKLYIYENMTTAGIAAKLGIGTQTALNHKTRAIDSLRKKLPPGFRALLEWLG